MLGLVLAPRGWLGIIAFSLLMVGAFAAETPATAGSLHNLSQAQADVDGVAYAGRVRVYTGGGRLVRLAPGQRAMTVARLGGRAYDVAASPTMVALVESRGRSRRLLAGPPSGPLRTLARCTGPSEEIPAPLLAVSGDTVAEALTCRRGGFQGATGVRLHTTGTVRTIFPPVGARVIGLSGAPGHLAIATQASGLRGPVRVQVNDSRTGAQRYSVAGLPEPLLAYAPVGVQADGLAVFCGAHGRLAWASAAAPSAHPVGRVGCPDSTLKVASGRVAYRSTPSDAYRVSDLAGRVRTLVQPSGDLPFDFNGERLLVRGLGCGADFLGEATRQARPYRGRSCRVRVLAIKRRHGAGTVSVTVACRPGCNGPLDVTLGRAATGSGQASMRLRHAGRRTYRVRLDRLARRRLRLYRRVPFEVMVNFTNPALGSGALDNVQVSGSLPGDGRRPYPPPPPAPVD